MKKILTLVTFIIIILTFIFCYGNKDSKNDFRYSGTLETTKVTLSSKVATNIKSFNFEEGDNIQADQELIRLDDETYKIASKQLNNDYERSLRLMKNGHTSSEQHDRIERAKKENDLYIKWCDIKSPISGTIITKFKEKGEFVAPGVNIVSIANTENIWAYFYIEHSLVNKLKVGEVVKCYLPELSGKVFLGKVVKINEEAEFTPKNIQTKEERTRLVYGIKVRFNNKDHILKAGMVLETSFERY